MGTQFPKCHRQIIKIRELEVVSVQ
jgi:hypothetical protein